MRTRGTWLIDDVPGMRTEFKRVGKAKLLNNRPWSAERRTTARAGVG